MPQRSECTFHGRTAHAVVAPHLGRSALDAAELMNVGVNYMREYMPSSARIHYALINGGGISPNVVQPRAVVRTLSALSAWETCGVWLSGSIRSPKAPLSRHGGALQASLPSTAGTVSCARALHKAASRNGEVASSLEFGRWGKRFLCPRALF